MRRFRRRRARPLWFPPLGTAFTVGEDTTTLGATTWNLPVLASGAIAFVEFPLTFDFGQERLLGFADPVIPTQSLSTMMASSWRLRRIVGDVFATFLPRGIELGDPVAGSPTGCLLTVGFMVRNIDETGLPMGSNVDALNRDDYDDPWIWRRTWLLGQSATPTRYVDAGVNRLNNFPATALGAGQGSQRPDFCWGFFPHENTKYGYKDGGSRVDQKTNRVIGPEQRLMIHFATKALAIQTEYALQADADVFGVFDLRLLGMIQRATNRRNASR